MIDFTSILSSLKIPRTYVELLVLAAVVIGCYETFHTDDSSIGDAYKSVIDVQSQQINKLSTQTISLIDKQNEQFCMIDSLIQRDVELNHTVESLSTRVNKLQTRVKTTEKALEDCMSKNNLADMP